MHDKRRMPRTFQSITCATHFEATRSPTFNLLHVVTCNDGFWLSYTVSGATKEPSLATIFIPRPSVVPSSMRVILPVYQRCPAILTSTPTQQEVSFPPRGVLFQRIPKCPNPLSHDIHGYVQFLLDTLQCTHRYIDRRRSQSELKLYASSDQFPFSRRSRSKRSFFVPCSLQVSITSSSTSVRAATQRLFS